MFCDDSVSGSTRCTDLIICCHGVAISPSTAAVRGQVVKSLLRMPIRRRICQCRRGFSYARSDTMIDDTLTNLSLEPKKIVTKNQSLRATGMSGHQNVPRRKQEVSGVVHNARLCVTCQHSPSGTCQIQILTTVQTFRHQFSHPPQVLVAHGAVTNSKDTTIKVHSACCFDSTSLTMQQAASGMSHFAVAAAQL